MWNQNPFKIVFCKSSKQIRKFCFKIGELSGKCIIVFGAVKSYNNEDISIYLYSEALCITRPFLSYPFKKRYFSFEGTDGMCLVFQKHDSGKHSSGF